MSLRPRLPDRADVLVVGAGLAGAATAHELVRAGRSVLLVERRTAAGAEASGRSASMIREDVADEALRPIIGEGAALHRSGGLAAFRPTGSFLLGRGDEDLSRRIPRARGLGRYFPGDGIVDSKGLLRRYLSGQCVVTGVETLRIEPGRHGAGLAVVTDAGSIEASVVVNAAGAWAGVVGGLPLEARKRHLFVSTPCGAADDWPFAWDDREGYYFRPHEGGLLLCACDQSTGRPGDNSVDPLVEAALRSRIARCQPGLLPLSLRDAWAGQRTFAPDGRFVLGWDPRVEGLFHVAALGGHGVTASPSLGRLASRMILAGPAAEIPEVARPFSSARLLG